MHSWHAHNVSALQVRFDDYRSRLEPNGDNITRLYTSVCCTRILCPHAPLLPGPGIQISEGDVACLPGTASRCQEQETDTLETNMRGETQLMYSTLGNMLYQSSYIVITGYYKYRTYFTHKDNRVQRTHHQLVMAKRGQHSSWQACIHAGAGNRLCFAYLAKQPGHTGAIAMP